MRRRRSKSKVKKFCGRDCDNSGDNFQCRMTDNKCKLYSLTDPVSKYGMETLQNGEFVVPISWYNKLNHFNLYKFYKSHKDKKDKPLIEDGLAHMTEAYLLLFYKLYVKGIRDLDIQTLQQSKSFGNTSTTTGLAYKLMKEGDMMYVLNCGSGSIRLYIYKMKDGIVLEEDKIDLGVSIVDYVIGGESINVLHDIVSEVPIKYGKQNDDGKIHYQYVITGTVREEYNKSKSKQIMNNINKIFGDTRFKGKIISSNEEGLYETLASKKLYEHTRKVIPYLEIPDMVFGHGNGSGQWVDARKMKLVKSFSFGMRNQEKLEEIYSDKNVEWLYNYILKNDIRTISLKSATILSLTTKNKHHIGSLDALLS
jgi:hypothetical protein